MREGFWTHHQDAIADKLLSTVCPEKATSDPHRKSSFPGSHPSRREGHPPPQSLGVSQGRVSALGVLGSVLPRETLPPRNHPIAPDSQSLQPKFNF